MKRVFSIMMALVLMLSLGVAAAATENTGSITITNATIGDTYMLYQIFEATYDTDAAGNANAVSYSITPTFDDGSENKIFTYMFGADGTASNTYFAYDAETDAVTRKENTDNADIFGYLTTMIRNGVHNGCVEKTADNKVVTYDGLDYGYYLIDKKFTGMTADQQAKVAVTIDSNTPNINVIDKNQKPATTFDKKVWDDQTETWESDTSASIGDIVRFKVEFAATNYDGESQIKYYTVKDTKGGAIWVEFNDITVTIGGVPAGKGFYHCAGESKLNTGEWTAAKNPDKWAATANEADWYLIHYGYDEFDIVIPWMTNHSFTGTSNGFILSYADNATSRYASPVNVVLTYSASVEPNATIGGGQNNNLWNTANLSWTSDTTGTPDDPSSTGITVYAMGLEKVDADTGTHLAGAVFELYRDEACTQPVHVIPTNIKGVYILDDLKTFVSGENRETSREKYKAYLDAYLNGAEQKNVVTSEANGKLVILGLEAGDYYLKEIEAPNGYNKLAAKTMVTVGQTNNTFFVVADSNGNVVDEQNAIEGYTKHNYVATAAIVKNSKGVELPSTGGEGAMMLITVGSMIAMAFAVLLITHKKMSVYHD